LPAKVILIAGILLVSGCGEGWPPLPGTEERGRRPSDTWETLRASSPWKRPLSSDPTYRRLAEVYRRMTALDEEARSRGLASLPGYIEARYNADANYAGARSLVFRLRSSGTEDSPRGQALIAAALANLDRAVEALASWLE